jgi:hypothetical protein
VDVAEEVGESTQDLDQVLEPLAIVGEVQGVDVEGFAHLTPDHGSTSSRPRWPANGISKNQLILTIKPLRREFAFDPQTGEHGLKVTPGPDHRFLLPRLLDAIAKKSIGCCKILLFVILFI